MIVANGGMVIIKIYCISQSGLDVFNPLLNKPVFLRASKSFENSVRKGEISPFGEFLLFSSNSKLWPANPFILEEFKICCLGKNYGRFASSNSILYCHLDIHSIFILLNFWYSNVCSKTYSYPFAIMDKLCTNTESLFQNQ